MGPLLWLWLACGGSELVDTDDEVRPDTPAETGLPPEPEDTASDSPVPSDSGESVQEDTGGADTADEEDKLVLPYPCEEGLALGVSTSSGCVLGTTLEDLEGFLGIPYAVAPIGDLRWQRPVPMAPWSEPLIVDALGETCIQAVPNTITMEPAGTGSEDCLTLNIWRPPGTSVDAKLPVMFFTHGGSYTTGSGTDAVFAEDPRLADEAILVTHNYRLGQLGFLAHPGLSDEDAGLHHGGGTSGNQGLFDTLMALQWVHDNAGQFGGDPDRLVVFGESAGGMTTCALLASPLAEGLFSSAIIESGPCGFLDWPLDEPGGFNDESAHDFGERFADALGCSGSPDDVVACLRALSTAEVVARFQSESFSPNIDGVFLPDAVPDLVVSGEFNRVPVVSGFNADEGVMFSGTAGITTWGELGWWIDQWGVGLGFASTEALKDWYAAERYDTPQKAYDAFYGEAMFVCPARGFLDAAAPWVEARGYLFSQVPSWTEWVPLMSDWGAYHASELNFVFGTQLNLYTAEERVLSELMRGAWVSVADVPAVDGVGFWPTVDAGGGIGVDGGTWVEFKADEVGEITGAFQTACDLFADQGWQVY